MPAMYGAFMIDVTANVANVVVSTRFSGLVNLPRTRLGTHVLKYYCGTLHTKAPCLKSHQYMHQLICTVTLRPVSARCILNIAGSNA